MQFTLGALIDRVGGVFDPLGASHTGLQLILVSLQFSKFLFMAVFHLCDAGLKLMEGIIFRLGHCRRRI